MKKINNDNFLTHYIAKRKVNVLEDWANGYKYIVLIHFKVQLKNVNNF